ncbi:MAG TPA: RND transporter [Stenotrophomonas sp.]|nr:RND transporter [Stenotrophomonas sp.]
MVIRLLTVAVTSALLAGCVSVGPNYQAPPATPVTLQGAAAPVFSTTSPVASWWAQFDDPVLEQLVHDALGDNLDLRIAMARVREARAVFVEQRLDQLPHVTSGGSYDRRKQPDATVGGERVFSETYQLGFDAGWELDLFGRQRRAAEAARADLGAEQDNLADAQVTVAAEVARNYFELRGTQKRIDVAKRTLVNLRDTQRLTEARWELGAGSELDVQSSRARLKAIEADIPLLEVAEVQSRHRLAVLLGQRPDALDGLLQPREVPAYAKQLPLGDTTDLLRQRADVRSAERRLAAATARIGVATAELYPDIRLGASVGAAGLLEDFGQPLTQQWSIGPLISWTLPSSGTHARIHATEAGADAALAEFDHSVLQALRETQTALSRYAQDLQRLQSLQLAQQQAALAASQNRRLYQGGRTPYLSSLDADRTLVSADATLAEAQAQVSRDQIQLFLALGGGWNADAVDAGKATR